MMDAKRKTEIREWLKRWVAYNRVVGDETLTEAGVIVGELLAEVERLSLYERAINTLFLNVTFPHGKHALDGEKVRQIVRRALEE